MIIKILTQLPTPQKKNNNNRRMGWNSWVGGGNGRWWVWKVGESRKVSNPTTTNYYVPFHLRGSEKLPCFTKDMAPKLMAKWKCLTSDECVLTSEVFDKDERERKRGGEREGERERGLVVKLETREKRKSTERPTDELQWAGTDWTVG